MLDIRDLKDVKIDKKTSRVLILSLILAFIIIIFIKKPLGQKIVEVDNQKAEIISESISESNASGGKEDIGGEGSEGRNTKKKHNVISSGEDDLVAINKALGSVEGIKYVEREISDDEDRIMICLESKRDDIQKAVDKLKELRLDKKIRSIDIVGMEDSKYKVILLFDL